MDDGDGERQPLTNAERQLGGTLVDIGLEAEALDELGDPRPAPSSRGRWKSRACRSRFCRTVSSV